MPEGINAQYTVGRGVGADNEIHIEGTGVVPTVKVPINEETLFAEGDVILDAAIAYLDESIASAAASIEIVEGGTLEIDVPVEGSIAPGQRINYAFNTGEGGIINLVIETDNGAYVNILSPEGEILADGTSPEDPGWEELELPPNFDLVFQVVTEEDAGEGTFTISVVPAE